MIETLETTTSEVTVFKRDSKFPLEKKREIAKLGMGVSLFLTAGSALFLRNKVAKNVHIVAGVALVGFSLWHTSLYPKLEDKSL